LKMKSELAEKAMPAIQVPDGTPVSLADDGDWFEAFHELTKLIESRPDRYPLGFQVDDSRESIYEGCGE
jgi:hypothetical protein